MAIVLDAPGYDELAAALGAAFEQAAFGKGHARHGGCALGEIPFTEQPMQSICRMLRSDDGMAYQAIKKVEEASRMVGDQREKELLGAIVYIAGMVVFHRQRDQARCGEAVMSSPSYCPHCHSIPCSCKQGGTAAEVTSDKYAGHPCAAPSTLGQWPDPARCVRCMQNPCRCGYMTGTAPADPHDPYSRR